MKKALIAVGALALLSVAYYGLSPLWRTSTLNEEAPQAGAIEEGKPAPETPIEEGMPSGMMEPMAAAAIVDTPLHPAEGSVRLIKTEAGYVLRYEDFKTINGPDLFVYLSKDIEAKEFVDLGPLRATEGNINYAVPEDVDPADYRYALVWCKQFSVLFNSADLESAR